MTVASVVKKWFVFFLLINVRVDSCILAILAIGCSLELNMPVDVVLVVDKIHRQ